MLLRETIPISLIEISDVKGQELSSSAAPALESAGGLTSAAFLSPPLVWARGPGLWIGPITSLLERILEAGCSVAA